MERTRFFLLEKPEDTTPINALCTDLEARRREWTYEVENMSTDNHFAILITISWEE